jgi:hypothetical protein
MLAFEESADDIRQNVASLGFDLSELARAQQLVIDEARLDVTDITEAGDFDLEYSSGWPTWWTRWAPNASSWTPLRWRTPIFGNSCRSTSRARSH